MSHNSSPFSELTGAEKQLKWLEYQTVRLPYVQGAVDAAPVAKAPVQEKETVQDAHAPSTPLTPPSLYPDFQKTRHSQYDAVIARMKQAEQKTTHYQSTVWSSNP